MIKRKESAMNLSKGSKNMPSAYFERSYEKADDLGKNTFKDIKNITKPMM